MSALISAEDARFFTHNGIDLPRLLSALIKNIKDQDSLQGGSTLTQQLIKNEYLSSEKTYKRKLQEIYLAYKMERKLSKEEIFEAYANLILFDGITPGVNNAAHRFFNKDISQVNIVEAAMLAAIVKSPTIYNPIRYPENALQRRNHVLDNMYINGYINEVQKNHAKAISIEEMLVSKIDKAETYPYQAYIDIVYEQVNELTGLDPYSTPMRIYTYLDTELQSQLDLVQAGEDPSIVIEDENQQIGAAVIDNSNGAVVGVIGGSNYRGERLFNRAYDMRRQPGSTMKPILSYALAVEHLDWNGASIVDDIPYTYPGTNINVSNVDGNYMGELTVEEALGYSRNTAALSTLQKVINRIGLDETIKYLDNIGILDCSPEEFTMSYGLGGMLNGVSPVQLAAAYRVLSAQGYYTKPTVVKRVEIIGGHTIDNQLISERMISEETAFIMSDTLKDVINHNYWGIGSLRQANRDIAAKTGTTSFDNPAVFNYPLDASKDVWYAGFCKNYTAAVWTGFDKAEKGTNNYFRSSGDTSRVIVARKIFSQIMKLKSKSGEYFEVPSSLQKVEVVKGTTPFLLPDQHTPSNMIVTGYFAKKRIPTNVVQPETLPELTQVNALKTKKKVFLNFPLQTTLYNSNQGYNKIYSNEAIYGKIQYGVIVRNKDEETIIKSFSNVIELDVKHGQLYYLECFYCYEKGDYTSNHYNIIIKG